MIDTTRPISTDHELAMSKNRDNIAATTTTTNSKVRRRNIQLEMSSERLSFPHAIGI